MTTASLSEVCSFVTDGTHYTPPSKPEGVPFLTVKDMHDGYLDFGSASRISDAEYARARAGNSAPSDGDVLFSKDGTVGKVHVVSESRDFAVLSSIAILRPRPALLDPRYLGQALRAPSVQDQALRSRTGTAIRRVILSDLQRVVVPLPPLNVQRRIARTLDAVDALRGARRRCLSLLADLKNSVLHEFLKSHPSDRVRLNDLLTGPLGNGISPSTAGTSRGAVLTLTALREGTFNARAVKECLFAKAPAPRQMVTRGTFLVSRGNGNLALVGRGAAVPNDLPGVAFPDTMIGAKVDFARVTPAFLEAVWSTSDVRDQIEQAATTTNGTFKINQTKLADVAIPLPHLKHQESFGQTLRQMEAQQRRVLSHVLGFDSLFEAVQHQAFDGAR